MKTKLPTTPGIYWYREKDGDEWRIIQVYLAMLNDEPEVNGMCCESPLSGEYVHVSEIDGEWLPIPTAEELVELQANAKMVDEGIDAWAVFKKDNEEFLWSEPCLPARIFTESAFICEPVTICRKGKE